MRSAQTRGFTLIEILIVIAVLGILLALGFADYLRERQRAELRDAAQQLAADLNRARSTAQRYSQDASVTVVTGGNSYTVSLNGTPVTKTLPGSLALVISGGSSSVVYKAPYGELDSTSGSTWEVDSPVVGLPSLYVKVVGVLGKAVVSATD